LKAIFFDKSGISNLKVGNYNDPIIGDHDVLIRVIKASVNPVDYYTVENLRVNPLPHIPGTEFTGYVIKVGSHVKDLREGDKVALYTRLFDGKCDLCLSGKEMLCRNGGRIGVDENGGFAEYASVHENNVFKVEDLDWDILASLPVASLTAYHALKEAKVKPNDLIVIFGASGNTGMFTVQLAKKMGAKVVAITRKAWVREFGADYVVNYDEALEKVKEISSGKMANVVVNSLGEKFWNLSLELAGTGGKIVTFGTLTGSEIRLNMSSIYNKHISIIGTTRGSRKEFMELINIAKELKVKVYKEFSLDEGVEAIKLALNNNRDGRILIKV
jgi:NADPH:quinone reductase-like Zn-dependent oxidoreductase